MVVEILRYWVRNLSHSTSRQLQSTNIRRKEIRTREGLWCMFSSYVLPIIKRD
ncbi:hypothetical protein LINGRAHAP2_LOCUS26281 [Linum grandiflorum]